MRNHLPRFGRNGAGVPSHFALAYDAWAPAEETGEHAGKVPAEQREERQLHQRENKQFRADWLEALEKTEINPDYADAYKLWKASLQRGCILSKEIALTSRLLVGHGNASATEVGLTVNHTWGVPVIPGSAMKGLCAHYLAATYGSMDPRFKGPAWDEKRRRVTTPPGTYYRDLFGAPDVADDASAGLVTFHDALYVPGSAADDKPFGVDVLTVHQRSYYGQDGGKPGDRWPNDYDSPNPVGFLTVRKGTKLLLAVSAPDPEWTKLALDVLEEAIGNWGVGAKTSAGYGRGGGS